MVWAHACRLVRARAVSALTINVINTKLEACRACVGRAQRKSTVHELCTVVHSSNG